MIRTVRLKNYTSFGEEQVVSLEPITVVVGANNSGKTNFLRFVDFVREGFSSGGNSYLKYWHRPPCGDGEFLVGWEVDLPSSGTYPRQSAGVTASYFTKAVRSRTGEIELSQDVVEIGGVPIVNHAGRLGANEYVVIDGKSFESVSVGMKGPWLMDRYPQSPRTAQFRAIFEPVLQARHVHLKVQALRADGTVHQTPQLTEDGTYIAPLIAHWLLEYPERCKRFNDIIARCLPEMGRVLARSVKPGEVRLYFEQKDGERFDSSQVSDGVLVFAGLIAHALEAPRNGLVLLEEPERGIHPRRLVEFVDVLRTLVEERGTQFILATHSPVLLNLFRDDPDAILTFRRGPNGTLVRRLSDMPAVAASLNRVDPGDLLASGAFNETADRSDPPPDPSTVESSPDSDSDAT